jgi:hypothetical protein
MYVCINLQCQYVLGECACTHQRKNHLRRIRRVDNVSMSLESLHALTSGKTICREFGRVDNVSMSLESVHALTCGETICRESAELTMSVCPWRVCMHPPVEKPSAENSAELGHQAEKILQRRPSAKRSAPSGLLHTKRMTELAQSPVQLISKN